MCMAVQWRLSVGLMAQLLVWFLQLFFSVFLLFHLPPYIVVRRVNVLMEDRPVNHFCFCVGRRVSGRKDFFHSWHWDFVSFVPSYVSNFKFAFFFSVMFESVFSPTQSGKTECLLIKNFFFFFFTDSPISRLPCRPLVAVPSHCILLNSQPSNLELIC